MMMSIYDGINVIVVGSSKHLQEQLAHQEPSLYSNFCSASKQCSQEALSTSLECFTK